MGPNSFSRCPCEGVLCHFCVNASRAAPQSATRMAIDLALGAAASALERAAARLN